MRGVVRLFAHLGRDRSGTTLVEMGISIAVFLVIFFGILEFGRFTFHRVAAEKGLQMAARIAAVRPPACAGVPETNRRAATTDPIPPRFGTRCNAGGNICLAVATVSCRGDTANPTVDEIWDRVRVALPSDAEPSDLVFSYAYDPDLGFLGGPYVPMITVSVAPWDPETGDGLQFRYVASLGGLARLAGATGTGAPEGGETPFPAISVSLPAEDLALGNGG